MHTIHRARHANAQTLNAACQRSPVVRFHYQVQMVALHRVVGEREPEAIARLREGRAQST